MKKVNPVLIIASVCAVAFLGGIGTGYLRGRKPTNSTEGSTENVKAVVKEEESVPQVINSVECYRVINEDRYILLYEVFTDDTLKEVQRANIENVYLPKEERETLMEGIDFYNKEEALMVMESFIS